MLDPNPPYLPCLLAAWRKDHKRDFKIYGYLTEIYGGYIELIGITNEV